MEYRDLIYSYIRISQLRRLHEARLINEKDELYHGQFPILEYIRSHENCSQKDVATRFNVSKPAVSKSISRMVKNGLLEVSSSQQDGRKSVLNVTEKGIKVLDNVVDIFRRIDEMTFEGFSEKELEQFAQYLNRVNENLETEMTRNKPVFQIRKEAMEKKKG